MFNGLIYSSILLAITIGLTITFSVQRILNFAHGSFFALGIFFTYSLTLFGVDTNNMLIVALSPFIAACLVGLIGLGFEFVLLRRIYHRPEVYQFLLTFGAVFFFMDVVRLGWGGWDISLPFVLRSLGTISIFGIKYPLYNILLILITACIFLLVALFLFKTNYGRITRAIAHDRMMSAALGMNVKKVYTLSFFIGTFLAALGGGLVLPIIGGWVGLEIEYLVLAIIVVVIGGIGSIRGAAIMSVVIGVVRSIGVAYFPEFELALIFLIAVAVLSIRPTGLFEVEF